jgi:hypothetical protein
LEQLGAFLGLPKCKLTPEQNLQWLGFLADSEEETFKLGEKKLSKLKQALQEALTKPTISARALAGLAGKIISASPAVLPAALFSKNLFQALKGKISWDQVFPTPKSVREVASFWLQNLDRLNGRKWWPRPVAMKTVVDASGVGFGKYLHIGGKEILFTGTFTDQQASGSSTEREVRGYAAALAVTAQQFPSEFKEASILIEGDNQGAIAAVNNFRSPVPEIDQILKGMFEICAEFRSDVIGKWIPRECLTETDALSRQPDPSDWGLAQELFIKVCKSLRVHPTVDLFASDAHHATEQFVSQYFTPGCMAVDALHLDWS